MGKQDSFLERFIMRLGLEGEPAPGQLIVEVFDNNRLLVENHLGVINYDETNITVKTHKGCVCIYGANLSLRYMTKSRLIIMGCIKCVQYG